MFYLSLHIRCGVRWELSVCLPVHDRYGGHKLLILCLSLLVSIRTTLKVLQWPSHPVISMKQTDKLKAKNRRSFFQHFHEWRRILKALIWWGKTSYKSFKNICWRTPRWFKEHQVRMRNLVVNFLQADIVWSMARGRKLDPITIFCSLWLLVNTCFAWY